MRKCVIKGLKRCPMCKSSNIYKRVRIVRTDRFNRKRNKNFIENVVKMYRCHDCKQEFDVPIIV